MQHFLFKNQIFLTILKCKKNPPVPAGGSTKSKILEILDQQV